VLGKETSLRDLVRSASTSPVFEGTAGLRAGFDQEQGCQSSMLDIKTNGVSNVSAPVLPCDAKCCFFWSLSLPAAPYEDDWAGILWCRKSALPPGLAAAARGESRPVWPSVSECLAVATHESSPPSFYFQGCFGALLDDVLEQPDRPILSCAVVNGEERRLLERWAQGPPLPTGARLTQNGISPTGQLAEGSQSPSSGGDGVWHDDAVALSIHSACARYPEAIAIWGPDCSITYSDLHQQALSISLNLPSPISEICLGLCCDDSVLSVLLHVSALFVGLPVMHIEPLLPDARIAFMMAAAKVRVVITDDNARGERLRNLGVQVLPSATVLPGANGVEIGPVSEQLVVGGGVHSCLCVLLCNLLVDLLARMCCVLT